LLKYASDYDGKIIMHDDQLGANFPSGTEASRV
jgi:hypothetical protein